MFTKKLYNTNNNIKENIKKYDIEKTKKNNDQFMFNNILIYGPKGKGKYTLALDIIKQYSESNLNYQKKMTNICNKNDYNIKISDIHYEIDIDLLGCNSKNLFNILYNNIIDNILLKKKKEGIILLKNFHNIDSELLDIFYSYLQKIMFSKLKLKFIILTEHISFISNDILNIFKTIYIEKISKSTYKKIYKVKDIDNINNLNYLKYNINCKILLEPYKNICNKIIATITSGNIDLNKIRTYIYDLLIYNTNIYDAYYYILESLIKKNLLNKTNINSNDLYNNTVIFFMYYNNNYRPIFHLENYIYYLVKVIHNI
tara:strand:+ start:4116 stop:5060 length:945 start_codon:yes stop_codon:yes gene_type:complete